MKIALPVSNSLKTFWNKYKSKQKKITAQFLVKLSYVVDPTLIKTGITLKMDDD